MEFLSPRVWLAIVVATIIGFGSGYYTKSKFADAAIVKQVISDQKDTAKNIVESVDTGQKVETSVQESNDEVTKIQEAVAKRPKLVKPVPQPVQESSNEKAIAVVQVLPTVVSCDAYQLDIGTVRLLNAARKGVSLDTVTGSDETLTAASGITIDKLLQNDLEVVKLFRDLAKRHDQLVTEVEEKLKQQAE